MKGKKNRKDIQLSTQGLNLYSNQSNEFFKIKFDVLTNDISCFIGKTRASKNVYGKTSKSIKPANRSASIRKRSVSKSKNTKPMPIQATTRNQSPDLIRQSSNNILTKIEEKGIRFDWKQEEQTMSYKNQIEQDLETQSLLSAFDSSFQKSFASTNDYFHYQQAPIYWQPQKTITQQTSSQNLFSIEPNYICDDWRTTLMIRNIPNKYTVNELAQQIDTQHSNTYDFLYLPCDLKNQCNVGYGFINFVSTEQLRSFYCKFDDYIWKRYRSQKICSLTYARLQGLSQLIEHFENSKVLNQKDKKYRPIIKYDQIQKMVLQQQKR